MSNQLRIFIDDYEVRAALAGSEQATLCFSSIALIDTGNESVVVLPAFKTPNDFQHICTRFKADSDSTLETFGLHEALVACSTDKEEFKTSRIRVTVYLGALIQAALERVRKTQWIEEVIVSIPCTSFDGNTKAVNQQRLSLEQVLVDIQSSLGLKMIAFEESHEMLCTLLNGQAEGNWTGVSRHGLVVGVWRNGMSIYGGNAVGNGRKFDDSVFVSFDQKAAADFNVALRNAFVKYRGAFTCSARAMLFGSLSISGKAEGVIAEILAIDDFLQELSRAELNVAQPESFDERLLGWFKSPKDAVGCSADHTRISSIQLANAAIPISSDFGAFETVSKGDNENLTFKVNCTTGKEGDPPTFSFELPLDRYDNDSKYLLELEKSFDGTYRMLMRAGSRPVAIKETGANTALELQSDRSYRLTLNDEHRVQAEIRRQLRDVIKTGFICKVAENT